MSDTLHKNHFVAKNHEDYLIEGDDLMRIQFSRYTKVEGKIKKLICELNIGKTQYMELLEKYGISEIVSKNWKIWEKGQDGEKGQYVPFAQ